MRRILVPAILILVIPFLLVGGAVAQNHVSLAGKWVPVEPVPTAPATSRPIDRVAASLAGPITIAQDTESITIESGSALLSCSPKNGVTPRVSLGGRPSEPVIGAVLTFPKPKEIPWSGWAEWMADGTTLSVRVHAGPRTSVPSPLIRMLYYRDGTLQRPGTQLVVERAILQPGGPDETLPKITYKLTASSLKR